MSVCVSARCIRCCLPVSTDSNGTDILFPNTREDDESWCTHWTLAAKYTRPTFLYKSVDLIITGHCSACKSDKTLTIGHDDLSNLSTCSPIQELSCTCVKSSRLKVQVELDGKGLTQDQFYRFTDKLNPKECHCHLKRFYECTACKGYGGMTCTRCLGLANHDASFQCICIHGFSQICTNCKGSRLYLSNPDVCRLHPVL